MTETDCKQDIITNGSRENTKQQQPDMAERQLCLKSHFRQDTQMLWWMATYKSLKCLFYVCMGDVGWLIYISDPILYRPEGAFNCGTLHGQHGGNKDVH